MLKAIPIALAGTLLLGSAPPSLQQPASSPWPFVSYELLPVGPGGAPGALADATNPVMEGWALSNTYTRIYRDLQVYAVLREVPGGGGQICRVTVAGLPDSVARPDLFSFGAGIDWCSPPGKAPGALPPPAVRARWQRGRIGGTALLRSSNGVALQARHITGLDHLTMPFTVAGIGEVVTFGWFPRRSRPAQPAARDAYAVRLADGHWALVLRLTRPFGQDVSACFIAPATGGAVPNESWISPAVTAWCDVKANAYLAAIPVDRRPQIVPTVKGK